MHIVAFIVTILLVIFCMCFDVYMEYSGECNVFDVTLSIYIHTAQAEKLA